MYKDNGTLDVEVIAEVGCIAHRLRNLNDKLVIWDEKGPICPNPLCPNQNQLQTDRTTESATPSTSTDRSKGVNRVENIFNNLHEEHMSCHRQEAAAEYQRTLDKTKKSKIFPSIGESESAMNSGQLKSTSSHAIVNETDASQCDGQIGDGMCKTVNLPNSESSGLVNLVKSDDAIGMGSESGKRPSISYQKMPEIQISNSDDSTTPISSNASPMTDHDQTQQQPSNEDAKTSSGDHQNANQNANENLKECPGRCLHYLGGWQSTLSANNISDEDLRNLIIELKSKVEFTESVNWLCKFLRFAPKSKILPRICNFTNSLL